VSQSAARPHILIVDDEPDLLELLELTLLKMGLDVTRATSVASAREQLGTKRFDLCLTDMRMPDGSGMHVVEHIANKKLDIPVAVMTAYASTENAVAALKAGAFDYLHKPVSLDDLRSLVKSALKVPESDAPASPLSQRLLGQSPAMANVRSLIQRLAKSDVPVYIHGESGSGKELAARMLHTMGPRAAAPFVPVNCGAIPETLMESEFFGYRKGAFTGADSDRNGFFQAANHGTLFLDEVAELPLTMQVKLLRAIQEKSVRAVGAPNEEPVDVRILSATHRDLAELVEDGRFRHDLYYRINVIELKVPPLRERRQDLPELAAAVLARLARSHGRATPLLAPSALEALAHYAFPGNVRELENILERALALAEEDRIGADDLRLPQHAPRAPGGAAPAEAVADLQPGGAALPSYIEQLERSAIQRALEENRWNKTRTAAQLGITFRALRYKLKKLGME
jgi:two-component system response regulator PilR (NtrC family)